MHTSAATVEVEGGVKAVVGKAVVLLPGHSVHVAALLGVLAGTVT